MVKSALQVRAEKCAVKFKSASRRPVVIEFAGSPKAGKTTTLGQVQAFLRRCGFRVEVVVERAGVCPIRDKKSANFNVWTACTTLAQILQHTQTPPQPGDPDVLILDRGLFDAVAWLSAMERLKRVRAKERKTIEEFLLQNDWCNRISGVILMTSSPKDALQREKGHLPVEGPGGSIMNQKVLAAMKKILEEVADRLSNTFNIYKVNTSSPVYAGSPKKGCEDVASKILDWIENELDEEILTPPKTKIEKLFKSKQCIGCELSKQLIGYFAKQGSYVPRAVAEDDLSTVQALPIVIIKNRKGEILRLRRKEKKEGNNLHKKIVIWAGGHVRKEDAAEGLPIAHCAVRELEEELRLSVETGSLNLLGAVYSANSAGTTKHVAIVHEWKADTDDVEIALSNAEFFERLGNSLSGTFITPQALLKEYEQEQITEDWSCQIIRNFMAETSEKARRDLFDKAS